MMCRERRSSTPAAQLMLWALVVCAAASWVAPVSAAAAPAGGLRRLAGSGPAYWQEAARYPLHYPAAQAAAEGFVVSPMGQQPAFCNARLVKPVCADGGLWMQNRCVAELQGLSMVPDSACPPGRDVFAGVPATAAASGKVLHPIPITQADLKRHSDAGLVFRGVAGSSTSSSVKLASQTGVVESGSGFWYSPK